MLQIAQTMGCPAAAGMSLTRKLPDRVAMQIRRGPEPDSDRLQKRHPDAQQHPSKFKKAKNSQILFPWFTRVIRYI